MASLKGFYKTSCIAIALFFLTISVALAVDDDFGPAVKIEGKHFSIYYSSQLDPFNLVQQLNMRPSQEALKAEKGQDKGSSANAWLADVLDTLFIQVCNILDMQLYSFRGSIKICRDSQQLNDIYYNFFQRDAKERAFYVYSLNTIYTSADNFKGGIIGHEIAHAVISHYFVVLPSVKVQEVLAMYVEYQLRQAGQ